MEEAPVSKRPRRNRARIEEDEDEDEEMPDVKPATPEKKTKKDTKPTKKSSPKKAMAAASPKESEEDIKEEAASESASEAESAGEEQEVNPKVAAKARAKIQTKLKTKASDPFPDWKDGSPVPYAALCATFSLIEMTTKRLEITEHCALFLRQVLRLTPDQLSHRHIPWEVIYPIGGHTIGGYPLGLGCTLHFLDCEYPISCKIPQQQQNITGTPAN